MAAPTIGAQGIITSWTGTANGNFLTQLGEHSATLTMDGGTTDRTAYAASLASRAHGAGLRSWGGTITGRLLTSSTPQTGYAGSLAFSGSDMYNDHIRSWNMNIVAGEHDATTYNASATAAGWKSFRPGLVSASGSYEALVDATNPLEHMFSAATSLPTGTFTLTSGNTLAASVIPTQSSLAIPVGDLNSVNYSYQTSGAITAAGTGNLWAAGTIPLPEWDESGTDGVADTTLTFQAAASRTYAGAAFWTSVSITHNPASYIEVVITFRGSGALTIG